MTNDDLPTLNLNDAFNTVLLPRDYVLPSFPRGKVGLLAAAGGTGKSYWTLQAAFQVAVCGCCDFDLAGAEFKADKRVMGSVLVVSLEDEAEDLTRRLQAIKTHYTGEQAVWLQDVADSGMVQILPLSGLGVSLFDEDAEPRPYMDKVIKKARSMQDCRLVVFDTLRRAHDCDENDNGVMSKILRSFEKMGKDLNASILLLHHENKAAMGNDSAGSGALRGASAIVDNARWVMRMQCMSVNEAAEKGIDEDERKRYIKVTNEKTNYGAIQPTKWLYRHDTGVLSKFDMETIGNGQKAVKTWGNNV